MIWITSDWHFNHDREFIWRPRGFSSVQEMNEAIVKRWNEVVSLEDDVYVLGDCGLGGGGEDALAAIKYHMQQLKGKIHIIRGNHDTNSRVEMYETCYNVVDNVKYADMIQYKGYHFYLSHYPTMTGNLEKETLKQCTCNLYGHTHQQTNFYLDMPYMYHVGVDSHNCYPILLDNIIEEMYKKYKECIDIL